MMGLPQESSDGFGHQDRRQAYRWKVAIPCTVKYGDTIIIGRIANLSSAGALITQVGSVPPKGALVVIRIRVEEKEVEREVMLTSQVFHHAKQGIIRAGQLGSFGVEFLQPVEEVHSKLIPVFCYLIKSRIHRAKGCRSELKRRWK